MKSTVSLFRSGGLWSLVTGTALVDCEAEWNKEDALEVDKNLRAAGNVIKLSNKIM